VNGIFAYSHTTGVRASGLAKFGGHKEHSEHLTDIGEMTCVNLNDIDCISLVELFEYHPVVCVFAIGNANAARCEFAPNAGMTDDTVDYVSVMWCNGRKKKE